MTPTLEQIRLAIRDRMKMVPDIGVIHPYERYAKAEADFAKLFTFKDSVQPATLRGWFIQRVAYRQFAYQRSYLRLETDWQIRGFMALRDAEASAIQLDGFIDRLRIAFTDDLTLGGLVEEHRDEGQPLGPQLTESAPFMFGGVLCHGARLDLMTMHYIGPDAPDGVLGDFKTFHANWDIPLIGNVQPPLPADATADATDHVQLETD